MRSLTKVLTVGLLLAAPFVASAQSIDQQTAALLAQVAQLQALLNTTQVSAPATTARGNCVVIQRNLGRGATGGDVTQLQQFLVAEGLLDPSNVTGYFGALTEGALQRWQAARNIVASGSPSTTGWGYAGPRTRTVLGNCAPAVGTGNPGSVISLPINQCQNVAIPSGCNNPQPIRNGQCIVGWQCTTGPTLPAQTFEASPRSGGAPLVVRFAGIVTSENAGFCLGYVCAATLDFGDGSTGAVQLPTAQGSSATYEMNHTYTTQGDFTAKLYQGPVGRPLVGAPIAISVRGIGSADPSASTTVTVTAPTGTLKKGDVTTLSWTVTGESVTSGTLSFDLYTQAGARIGTIVSTQTFSSGSVQWKVPSSTDGSCSGNQPNGLCGVNLTAGSYYIKPVVSGNTASIAQPQGPAFTIAEAPINTEDFVVQVAPTVVEQGKTLSVKYRVKNPPFGSVVGLWLIKPSGENLGLIGSRLDADNTLTTYPWSVPLSKCDADGNCRTIADSPSVYFTEPGTYHVLARLYTPASAYLGGFPPATVTLPTFIASATSSSFKISGVGSGSSCLALLRNFGPGDTDATTGGEVTKLQQFLALDAELYPEGLISGFYGPATRRAVERWQAANGVATAGSPESNGYGAIGPRTRALLAGGCTSGAFNATPRAGSVPLVVTFTSTASGNVAFGDGQNGFITANIPLLHTYTVKGTYVATLAGTSGVSGTVSVNAGGPAVQTACADIMGTLDPEDTDADTGGDVSRLQQFLAQTPSMYPEGLVTGYYGPATVRAVQRFQSARGIASNGTPETTGYGAVGPSTLAVIACNGGTGSGPLVATPSSGPAPLTVTFTTNGVAGGVYDIDFGDGTTHGTLSVPPSTATTHTYSANGSYLVRLSKTGTGCEQYTGSLRDICLAGNTTEVATTLVTIPGTGTSTSTDTTVTPSLYSITNASTFYSTMYSCVYGRTPTTAELSTRVVQNGTTIKNLLEAYRSFFGSSEYTAKATSNTAYVSQVYKCALFRQPTSADITAGTTQLVGGTTRDAFLASIIGGTEFQGIVGPVLRNVTTLSMSVINGLTATPSIGTSPLTVKFTFPRSTTGKTYQIDFGDPYGAYYNRGANTMVMTDNGTDLSATHTYVMDGSGLGGDSVWGGGPTYTSINYTAKVYESANDSYAQYAYYKTYGTTAVGAVNVTVCKAGITCVAGVSTQSADPSGTGSGLFGNTCTSGSENCTDGTGYNCGVPGDASYNQCVANKLISAQ